MIVYVVQYLTKDSVHNIFTCRCTQPFCVFYTVVTPSSTMSNTVTKPTSTGLPSVTMLPATNGTSSEDDNESNYSVCAY